MKVLQLDSSILGEASVSRQLTGLVVEQLRASDPDLKLVHEQGRTRDQRLADFGADKQSHCSTSMRRTMSSAA